MSSPKVRATGHPTGLESGDIHYDESRIRGPYGTAGIHQGALQAGGMRGAGQRADLPDQAFQRRFSNGEGARPEDDGPVQTGERATEQADSLRFRLEGPQIRAQYGRPIEEDFRRSARECRADEGTQRHELTQVRVRRRAALSGSDHGSLPRLGLSSSVLSNVQRGG